MARVDRDFQGLGLELLTDAGKYVIRFDGREMHASAAAHAALPEPDAGPAAAGRGAGNALVRAPAAVRELNETMRLVVLGAAVGVDFDYFSQHSQGHGMLPFFMPFPMPMPAPAPAPEAQGGEEAPPGDGGGAGGGSFGEGYDGDGGGGGDGAQEEDDGDFWGGFEGGEDFFGDGDGDEGGGSFWDGTDFFGDD